MEVEKKVMTHKYIRVDNGEMVYLQMTFDEWMDRIWSDGWSSRWCITLDDGAKAYDHGLVRSKSFHTAGNWPMASSACGGLPEDIPEMMADDKKLGVSAEYNSEGDPIFTSKSHRKQYCEARGIFDRNAGYGDPKPKNIT